MKQLQENLGFLLVQCCRAHRNRAELALNDLGLHVGQEMLLLQLYADEGIAQSQLAERACVEPPTITKALNRLESAGFVERRPDPDDARVSRVYLTPQGRDVEKAVMEVWRDLERRVLSGLTAVEQALLRRLLMQMRDNLD